MSENTNVSVACLITIPGYAETDRTANGIIWVEANVARHLNNLIERLSDIFEAQVSTFSTSIFFSFLTYFKGVLACPYLSVLNILYGIVSSFLLQCRCRLWK
jgi:hypothetical protein